MSRIGNLPIELPEKVVVTVNNDNTVVVNGPLGKLEQKIDTDIEVKVNEGIVKISRPSDQIKHKALHGLYRALINNMVVGVSVGYTIKQELVGVGYKAVSKGQQLELALGFSHNIIMELPIEVKVEAKTERRQNPIITLTSIDKQLIGLVAAKIRSLRPPEPYKGKGVKYVGEVLRRKAGKTAAK